MTLVQPSTIDLFTGIHDLINAHFGVSDYRTKTSLRLVAQASGAIDGKAFVQSLFDLLRENWLHALPNARVSRQNFRWRDPQLRISDRNSSLEVTLERALIRAAVNSGRVDWSNQVPVVSGIAGARAYKRQAIDLVHDLQDCGFEFVELKIKSNTPLHATIEVLIYGLFWLLSRQSKIALGYPDNPILDAPVLQLSTLAPADFYVRLNPSGLADAIDRGVHALGQRHGVTMRFRQMAFPQTFRWPAAVTRSELLSWLDCRELIAPCV